MGYLRVDGKDELAEQIDDIQEELNHVSNIFPEDTNETVTFEAGAVNNAWLAWTELVDNNAVTFSSKVDIGLHISAVLIEKADTINKTYMYEIAYGDAKTVVARSRFAAAAANKGNPIQEEQIHADDIPSGETVYYRMKSETRQTDS